MQWNRERQSSWCYLTDNSTSHYCSALAIQIIKRWKPVKDATWGIILNLFGHFYNDDKIPLEQSCGIGSHLIIFKPITASTNLVCSQIGLKILFMILASPISRKIDRCVDVIGALQLDVRQGNHQHKLQSFPKSFQQRHIELRKSYKAVSLELVDLNIVAYKQYFHCRFHRFICLRIFLIVSDIFCCLIGFDRAQHNIFTMEP